MTTLGNYTLAALRGLRGGFELLQHPRLHRRTRQLDRRLPFPVLRARIGAVLEQRLDDLFAGPVPRRGVQRALAVQLAQAIGFGAVRQQPRHAARAAPVELVGQAHRRLLRELLARDLPLEQREALVVALIGGVVDALAVARVGAG